MNLLYIAQMLCNTGVSLIPVFGDKDSSQPKAAALAWKQYQTEPASWREIVSWLAVHRYQFGVVTGRVSGVVVVDFDSLALWNKFIASPLLTLLDNPLVVQTRRGIHLYLPVAKYGPALRGRAGVGWDLKADGGYVVGPHSVIDGHVYGIVSGDPSRLGSAKDEAALNAVLAWLDNETPPARRQPPEPAEPEEPAGRLPIQSIGAAYKTLATNGRNNALFSAARLAHDHFYPEEAAAAVLMPLHIAARGAYNEAPTRRQREALKTIRSAYKYPRRAIQIIPLKQLPNVIREALAQKGLTAVARLIDGLRTKGYAAGAELTRRDIAAAVAGLGIGGHTQRRAVDWIFALPKTLPHADALRSAYRQEQNTNEFVYPPKTDENSKRGRIALILCLPSDEELAAALGIRLNKASDFIPPEEQKSPRTYRAGLHGRHIMRRPGEHTALWLARRLGVCLETLRTYNRVAGVVVEPQYRYELLTPALLKKLPNIGAAYDYKTNRAGRVRTPGYCLIDRAGKRYPALRPIGAILMRTDKTVLLAVRGRNLYYHNSQAERTAPTPPPLPVAPAKQTPLFTAAVSPAPRQEAARAVPTAAPRQEAAPAGRAAKKVLKWRRVLPVHNARSYRSELPGGLEYLAAALHRDYPEIALPTARRAVHLCGGQKVYAALAALAAKQHVRNPSGFLLTLMGYPAACRAQEEEKNRYLRQTIMPRRSARWLKGGQ